ncbi:hypothetical protein [Stenotrophomonas sp. PD6]|uniref:hypothetical protein n=1 Tax=Stenotrophomonas sp. PD6 TaxID=3368612 RepID=UPI003B9E4182
MGKGWAYLALSVVGALMLWGTGQFDEVSGGTNLKQREAFWQARLAQELPPGTARSDVDAFAARNGLVLSCQETARKPPASECHADDPKAKGGTATHPMTREVVFAFEGNLLKNASTSLRSLEFGPQ